MIQPKSKYLKWNTTVFEFPFIVEGATREVCQFHTPISQHLVRQASKTRHFCSDQTLYQFDDYKKIGIIAVSILIFF